jgi:hypothetical protein
MAVNTAGAIRTIRRARRNAGTAFLYGQVEPVAKAVLPKIADGLVLRLIAAT